MDKDICCIDANNFKLRICGLISTVTKHLLHLFTRLIYTFRPRNGFS